MRRLLSKLATSALASFKQKRLLRLAEWVDADINDPNLVQDITDVMASGGQIQIQYAGEWKLISPYGWNTSKQGNILLMCYKDTGEIRSYRFDRIEAVQLDSSQVEDSDIDQSNGADDLGVSIPEFNESETNTSPHELPFDDELEIIEDEENQLDENDNQPQEENKVDNEQVQNDEENVPEEQNQEEQEEVKQ